MVRRPWDRSQTCEEGSRSLDKIPYCVRSRLPQALALTARKASRNKMDGAPRRRYSSGTSFQRDPQVLDQICSSTLQVPVIGHPGNDSTVKSVRLSPNSAEKPS